MNTPYNSEYFRRRLLHYDIVIEEIYKTIETKIPKTIDKKSKKRNYYEAMGYENDYPTMQK